LELINKIRISQIKLNSTKNIGNNKPKNFGIYTPITQVSTKMIKMNAGYNWTSFKRARRLSSAVERELRNLLVKYKN